jgi:hypothetical protein
MRDGSLSRMRCLFTPNYEGKPPFALDRRAKVTLHHQRARSTATRRVSTIAAQRQPAATVDGPESNDPFARLDHERATGGKPSFADRRRRLPPQRRVGQSVS